MLFIVPLLAARVPHSSGVLSRLARYFTTISKAVKEFYTPVGTILLTAHTFTHEQTIFRRFDAEASSVIVVYKKNAAVQTAFLGSLPFSFAYKYPRMIACASALVDIGKVVSKDEKINVAQLCVLQAP